MAPTYDAGRVFINENIPIPSIEVEWLGESVVYIIHTKEQLDSFAFGNPAIIAPTGVDWFLGCWERNDGTVWNLPLKICDQSVLVMVISKPWSTIIIHECIHMVDELLDCTGIPISMENTETRAYLTEWLYKKVYDIIYPNEEGAIEDYVDW